MNCKTCFYFEAFSKTDKERGLCHRFPPDQDGSGKFSIDQFSTVPAKEWCGEYKKGVKK